MQPLEFHQIPSFFESIDLNKMDYDDLERNGLGEKHFCLPELNFISCSIIIGS